MEADRTPVRDRPKILPPRLRAWSFGAVVTGLAFSEHGHAAFALGDGTVRIVGPEDGEPIIAAAHDGAGLCLQTDVDGAGWLSGGDDGRLVRIDASGAITALLQAPGREIESVAVSRAGRLRAIGLGKEVRLLDATGAEIARTNDHPSTVTGLAFNPKGKRLAASHYNGATLWWAGSVGRNPKRLAWRGSHIGLSWSPDGDYLVTATQERGLHGWRLRDGADMAMSGYAAKIRSLAWMTKPPYLLTSGAEAAIAWPFAGAGPMGKRPVELGTKAGTLVTAVVTASGHAIAAIGYEDGEVCLADLANRELVGIKPAGGGAVTMLAWSADDARLAAGTEGGEASVIDLSRVAD
jgi:WD40 repeat protein